jgi:hypothetical protein
MRRLALPFLLTAATLALIDAAAAQLPFANGPAEWEWAYHPPALEGIGLLLAAVLMIPLVWWAAQAGAQDEGRKNARWAVPLLIALGWVLTLDVARGQQGGFPRVMDALASRHTFGYVFDEGLAPGTRELLADYPAATAGLNQHARTHPPGALLLVRGLDLLGSRLPPAERWSGGLGTSAAASLPREVGRAAARHRPWPRVLPAPSTLVLLALLLPALSALAAWPLHRLALRLGLPPGAALLAAAFWLLVPARSLFTPTLDQALPFLLLTAAALAAGPGRWRAFAAGLALFLCLFVSYGYLAPAALAGLLAIAPIAPREPRAAGWPRQAAVRAALLAAGFLLPWIALALCAGYDPWTAFRTALTEHRAIAVAPRSYSTWLAWNPWDFALLLGPAVLGLAAAALRPLGERTAALRALTWGWWALLALLLASGSVRGEVGRIWLMLMPFACLLAAAAAAERWGRRAVWPGAFLLLEGALLLTLAAGMTFVS